MPKSPWPARQKNNARLIGYSSDQLIGCFSGQFVAASQLVIRSIDFSTPRLVGCLSDQLIDRMMHLFVGCSSDLLVDCFPDQLVVLILWSHRHISPNVATEPKNVATRWLGLPGSTQDLSIKKAIKTSNINFAKSKAIREMKCFSTLVLNIEQYEKSLLQLSAKSKINLMRFAKLGSNRDFRIDCELVKKTLNENVDEPSDVDERNENGPSRPISSTAVSSAARAKDQKTNSSQNEKPKAKR
uniref:FANCI solenoid 4 domain-containing protein n=1 Tax=Romanomermis culicivorax TaxID=13658 RepID=A0A915LAC7_ROMCU